MTAKAMGTATA
jgi:hypothetical protein